MNGFLDPDKILDELNLKEDMIAADFGSGSGGIAIPLAKRLKDGLVYALDIKKEALLALKGRFIYKNITNINVIRGNLEKDRGSTLSDSSVDLVLIINILFQSDNKNGMIEEAKRILKKGGELLVIDWITGKSSNVFTHGKIPADAMKKAVMQAGFNLKKEFSAGEYHYGLIFEKNRPDANTLI